jgi:hypothetical protein
MLRPQSHEGGCDVADGLQHLADGMRGRNGTGNDAGTDWDIVGTREPSSSARIEEHDAIRGRRSSPS